MRIATLTAYDTSIAQLQKRQTDLTRAQEQLTSGKRVDRASVDPAAAARAERALAAIQRADAGQRALDASRNSMTLTEAALGDAGEMLQQARELALSAGNSTLSDSDRRVIAEALRGLRNDLLAVANRTDGAGRYLFGGQGSDGPPVVELPPDPADPLALPRYGFNGSSGEQTASAGEPTPLTVDGNAVFVAPPDPSDPTLTLPPLFTALDRLAAGLETPSVPAQVPPVDYGAMVRTGLGDIDAASANVGQWRSRAGEALNRINGIESRLSQSKLDAQRDRSNAEDLDLIAAISEFQNQQTGYDAALKMFSTVQRLSLFDYLK
jgi:flagellar hook-associated protein 3 FlgL